MILFLEQGENMTQSEYIVSLDVIFLGKLI